MASLLVACTVLSGCLFPPVTTAGSAEDEDPLEVFGVEKGQTAYRLRRAVQERNGTFETTVYLGDERSVPQGPTTTTFSLPPDLRRFTIRLDWEDQCQRVPFNVPQCSIENGPSQHDLDFSANLNIANESQEEIWNRTVEDGAFGAPDRPAEIQSTPTDDIQRPAATQLAVKVWAESSQGINYTVSVQYEHLVPLSAGG